MAFMLPALGGLLSNLLFKKKGGKVVHQTSNGQAFMQAKPVLLKHGGAVYEKASPFHQMLINNPGGIVRKKKGGKIKKKRKN